MFGSVSRITSDIGINKILVISIPQRNKMYYYLLVNLLNNYIDSLLPQYNKVKQILVTLGPCFSSFVCCRPIKMDHGLQSAIEP